HGSRRRYAPPHHEALPTVSIRKSVRSPISIKEDQLWQRADRRNSGDKAQPAIKSICPDLQPTASRACTRIATTNDQTIDLDTVAAS
ncbi:hypothetical protein, partial [Rhodopseudomonas palustris]|uniref:hypothetical protein n=1 Tax=Rhodopseudomonas palustris TaxID=1076 RepID=UPI001AEC4085